MAFWFPEDHDYDENVRQTGFRRYKQLLSLRFGQWWKVNLLTLLGFLPLAGGIFYAVAVSSVLVLLPCSTLGGMVAGPFLAGLYDSILRGLRDDPLPWKDAYARSWRQNWKGSLLPGALLGLLIGLYSFMGMLFWWAQLPPSLGTVALYLFGLLLILAVNALLWPQIVLFEQSPGIRLRNCALFCIKHFWRVMGMGLLQLGYTAILVLFAPWSLALLLFTGIWYVVFLSQILIYEQMDKDFSIEALFDKAPAQGG